MSGTIANPMLKQTLPNPNGADKEAHETYGMLMSLALDGLLDIEEERDLHAHLALCDPCSRQWQLWQRVDQQFAMPPMLLPPVDLVAQVEQRISAAEQRRDFRVGVLLAFLTIFLWIVGFAGVGLVIGFLVFNQLGSLSEIFHSLAMLWTTLLVLLESTGRALVGLSENPSAVGIVLGYLALATASLAGWTRFLRRTTRPYDSQSLI
ncbi:MAG: zf-HC2 domain-containing protein [Caldilineaceae bacterium]|nr:zf-HC2 domain-containing protein [Caldilineaceae bacterium]